MHGCGNYDHIRPLLLLSDALRRIIYIITSCISRAFISEFPQLFQHLYTQQCRTCFLPAVIRLLLVGNAEGWKMDKFKALFTKNKYSLRVVCVYSRGVWVWVVAFSNTRQKTDLPQAESCRVVNYRSWRKPVVELWQQGLQQRRWVGSSHWRLNHLLRCCHHPSQKGWGNTFTIEPYSLQPHSVDTKVITAQWHRLQTCKLPLVMPTLHYKGWVPSCYLSAVLRRVVWDGLCHAKMSRRDSGQSPSFWVHLKAHSPVVQMRFTRLKKPSPLCWPLLSGAYDSRRWVVSSANSLMTVP